MDQQLLDAAKEGDVDLMREALQNGANVNTRHRYGFTPFHMACFHGRLEAVQFLSTVSEIDVNAVTISGRSAFHYACLCGHLEVVRFLVALPDINLLVADNECHTALHHAVSEGHLAVVQFLLSSNLGFDVETRDRYGRTALLLACAFGLLDIVEYLLTTHNADVRAIDNSRNSSCLHLAASSGNLPLVTFLLSSNLGFNLEARDKDGDTALLIACYCGHLDTVKYLLTKHNADVHAINILGNSCLHAAVSKHGDVEVARYLLENYPDANFLAKTDNEGGTPFDDAIAEDQDESAYYILTVAYKSQVLERKGNQAIHAILEVAEYQYLTEEEEEEDDEDEQEEYWYLMEGEEEEEGENHEDEQELVQQQQQTLRVYLPVGKLTVDNFRELLLSFDADLMCQRDNTHAFPFHVARRTDAPVEILNLLLEVDDPGTLHIADFSNSLSSQSSFQYYVCTDREEQQLASEKLDKINACGPSKRLTNAIGEDIGNAKALYKDIVSNENLWMDKVLRIQLLPIDGIFSLQSFSVFFILTYLGEYYSRCKKPRTALRVHSLAIEIMEITEDIIFATPLSPSFEGLRTAFESYLHFAHFLGLEPAVEVNAKPRALESFRKLSRIEVRGNSRTGTEAFYQQDEFIPLVEAIGKMELYQRAVRERSADLLMDVFDEIGDDKLWDFLDGELRAPEDGISWDLNICSLCRHGSTIECSCGKAAYCSVEHRQMHWHVHRNDCCCAHCGDNNNSDLKFCPVCMQGVFCCQEHFRASWPTHRQVCEEPREATG